MGNYIYYSLIFSGIVICSYLSYRSEKKQKNYYQKITSAYTMDWGATPSSQRVPTTPDKAGEDSSAEGSTVHKNERSDTLGETPESVPARDVEEFVESFTNIVQRRPLLFPIAGWAMMITIIFFVGYIILAFITRRPSEEYVPFIFVVSATFPVAVFCIRFGRDDYVNFRRAEIVHKPLGGARKSFPYHAIAGYYFDPRNTEHGVFEVQTRQGYKARFVPGMYNCVYVGSQIAFRLDYGYWADPLSTSDMCALAAYVTDFRWVYRLLEVPASAHLDQRDVGLRPVGSPTPGAEYVRVVPEVEDFVYAKSVITR